MKNIVVLAILLLFTLGGNLHSEPIKFKLDINDGEFDYFYLATVGLSKSDTLYQSEIENYHDEYIFNADLNTVVALHLKRITGNKSEKVLLFEIDSNYVGLALNSNNKYTLSGSIFQSSYNELMSNVSDMENEMREIASTSTIKLLFSKDEILEKIKTQKNKLKKFFIEFVIENKSHALSYSMLFNMLSMFETEEEQNTLNEFLSYVPDEMKENEFYLELVKKVDLPLIIGKRFPEFEVLNASQKSNKLIADNKGKYTLIEFWASWCSPCLKELPHINKFYEENSDKINIVRLSIDKDANKWKKALAKFVSKEGIKNYIDNNELKEKVQYFLNINSVPFKILLDNTGKIVQFGDGTMFTIDQIKNLITQK